MQIGSQAAKSVRTQCRESHDELNRRTDIISQMCALEQEIISRGIDYHRWHPEDVPKDFPNREEVFMLKDFFHTKGGPFQRLIECGGIRYVLLLEYNKKVDKCLENDLLEQMYQCFEWERENLIFHRSAIRAADGFMKHFWPYLNEDFQKRHESGTVMDPIGPLDYDRKDSHKLQLKTIDGSVCAIEHDTHIDNREEPCDNPYPHLRCFCKSEVEILETITGNVFRVRIQDEEYALKAGWYNTMSAVAKLHSLPRHPNVLSFCGLLVDDERKVMGMLTPFIPGTDLLARRTTSATTWQKEKWKTGISDAINFLHGEGVIWGDAKPDNIIISSDTDEPMLIDFDGGWCPDWVDEDLQDTLEGELQALSRILEFVDRIPTSED